MQVELVSTVPGRIPLPELSEQEKGWLYTHYQFDVDLIAPHPCEKCLIEDSKLSKEPNNIRYGSLRVREILNNFNSRYVSAFIHLFDSSVMFLCFLLIIILFREDLSQQDILLMQPTSIGLGIDNAYIGMILLNVLYLSL